MKSDALQSDKPSDYVPWDLEAVKQEICDLFARYGSGNYMPTEEEKGIIDTGLDEILTMPPVAQSGDVAPAAVTAAIERMLGYPDGSYMRCPFCGGKSRSMHKDDCAILIVAAALRAPSAGERTVTITPSVGGAQGASDANAPIEELKNILVALTNPFSDAERVDRAVHLVRRAIAATSSTRSASERRDNTDILRAIVAGYLAWEVLGDSVNMVKAINEAEVRLQEIGGSAEVTVEPEPIDSSDRHFDKKPSSTKATK